mgnify:CR=1 FL=1
MRILIVGGSGLISQYITRQLLARGDEVVWFNRGQSSCAIALPNEPRTLVGDRHDESAFEAAVRGHGPWDAVIDMIGYQPGEVTSLLRAVEGVAGHLVFCSTVDVYAKPYPILPVREDSPLGRNNAYSAGKIACEELLAEAHAAGRIPTTVIRPAHTYGEGRSFFGSYMNGGLYLDRLRRGKPILVHGDGQSLWTACHGDDVARAFLGALDNPTARGRAYHVTAEEWLTWNRYHELAAEALGAPAPTLVHVPSALLARLNPARCGICLDNFQFDNIFDNSAARADLGFSYTIPFVEGVRQVVAWLEAHGGLADSDADDGEDAIIAAWQAACERLVAEAAR